MLFKNRKWALVLSGGGAKGIAHIGVLKFLDENGLKPDMVAGTSVGAIIGSFYCCGMSAKDIEDFILNDFNYKEYFEMRTLHLPDMAITKALQFGESIKNLFSRTGVDSGHRIHAKVLELTHGKKFGEEKIPFFCNSVDIVNHRHIIHDSGTIADAVRASCAVPGLFSPCKMDGGLLVDGGIYENMPVFIPRKKGVKKVLAVNLNSYLPAKIENIETGADVMIESLFISSRINVRAGENKPDIEIIATEGRSSDDFSNPQELVSLGYLKTKEKEKEIIRMMNPFIKKIFS